MPELPDLAVYVEHLEKRLIGRRIESIRVASPFVVRTVAPPLREAQGHRLVAVRRMAKRIVFEIDDGRFVVVHLMIAGRFRWKEPGAKIPGKIGLLALDFEHGTLLLTEASTRRRASVHFVEGRAALQALDPGGIDAMTATVAEFAQALRRENHTIKRTLTDPRLLSGIGNAYSDEILHRARLSPVRLTRVLTDDEIARLHAAVVATLGAWTDRLRREAGETFPENVTAFRPEMAVHGKYREPCPVCGKPVQRIVHAENESNYCAQCQTGGRLLADRALSKLLHGDWPRTLEEMEDARAAAREVGVADERSRRAQKRA